MNHLERLGAFIADEWRSVITQALSPYDPAPVAPAEGDLIQRASAGQPAKAFLQSDQVRDFMTRAEAQLTHAMLTLPLEDDAGRRNLAAAINATRGLSKYLLALAQDGQSAERELERLRSGRRDFF